MSEDASGPSIPPSRSSSGLVVRRSEFMRAYEEGLPEILAVKEEDLVPVNFDVPQAVMTVLGVLPNVAPHLKAAEHVDLLDQRKIASVEDYARAAGEAHAEYLATARPPAEVKELYRLARHHRKHLRGDARRLVARGLLSEEHFEHLKGRVGYTNVGFELLGWIRALQAAWPRIQGKTPITLEELADAETLVDRLAGISSRRHRPPEEIASVTRRRHQAVTLLVTAYEELRRAVTWSAGTTATPIPSRRHCERRRSMAGGRRARTWCR